MSKICMITKQKGLPSVGRISTLMVTVREKSKWRNGIVHDWQTTALIKKSCAQLDIKICMVTSYRLPVYFYRLRSCTHNDLREKALSPSKVEPKTNLAICIYSVHLSEKHFLMNWTRAESRR